MKLQYPYLPCVWVGSREKKILVPMEVNSFSSFAFMSSYSCYTNTFSLQLCAFAEAQEYGWKLSDFQTSTLIKVAATPAYVRKRKILKSVRDMKLDKNVYAQHFGISVDSQMTKIQGQHLCIYFQYLKII